MTKTAKTLNHNDYTCPVCGDKDIVGDSLDWECGSIYQRCACSACDATWVNVYDFREPLWITSPDSVTPIDIDTPISAKGDAKAI